MIQINNISRFNNDFLGLLSKINDSICLKVDSDKMFAVTASNDNTIVVYSRYKQQQADITDRLTLNIPDISRLTRIFSCLSTDNVSINVDSNCLSYKSTETRFKYYLLEDGILSSPAVSIDKIKKLSFDSSFNIAKDDVLKVIKGSSLTSQVDKLYFFTESNKVFAEVTDKEIANTDSYTQLISNTLTGNSFDPLSINFEIFRMISSLKFTNVSVKVNTDVKVLLFEVDIEDTKHNFICSTYIK